MEDRVIVKAENLEKIYGYGRNALRVLKGISFDILKSEIISIVGPSGAGKSTLLNLVGCLDFFQTGNLEVLGKDVTHLSVEALSGFRNRHIGFIFQLHNLLPEFSALENVMMPLLIRGVSRAEAAVPALARLEETGLKARASHRAGELSGGEQQRVVLARALVGNPRFLLADEPTGNLDHRTGEMIIGLLTDLHRSHGLTSVYVTHNLSFARRCDRVLRLEAGALVLEAARSEAPDADEVRVQSGKSYV